jgi:hypothetical protein
MSDTIAVTGRLDVAHSKFLLNGIPTGGQPIGVELERTSLNGATASRR